MFDLIKNLIGPILTPLIDRIPNPNERAIAREAAEDQMMSGLMAIVQGQLEINMKEAGHKSVFVAGWRPAVGWVCVSGLAWNFIVQPIFMWIAFSLNAELEAAPKLDITELVTILVGMLGLAGYRTYEKKVGVDTRTITKGE
jgi:hypothetical protein